MVDKLFAVKGMNDILPGNVPRKEKLPDSAIWRWFERTVETVMARHAYQHLLTPIVEPTSLFVRGIGEATDIVEKEMYSWVDAMNGDALTLRPEITAGIVRAMVEHNALYNGPLRVWSIGPVFRHERPQKGRYRQFYQLDVEALGFAGPDVDAELILMVRSLWQALGLRVGEHVRLELNSLGQPAERAAHRAALVAYFTEHMESLDEDSRRRLHSNPLRILDSKNPALQALAEAAPKLAEHLGEASRAHLSAVCAVLDAAGLPYRINPRLVRGLDYYNLTVFEWVTDHLGSQGTCAAAGAMTACSSNSAANPHRPSGSAWAWSGCCCCCRKSGCRCPIPRPTSTPYCPTQPAFLRPWWCWTRCASRACRFKCTRAAQA